MTDIKRRWALYARTQPGVGAEIRFHTLREWAKELGAEVTHEFVDVGPDRDGRDAALGLLAYQCIEAVAVFRLEDLGRKAEDLNVWVRCAKEYTGTVLVMADNMDLSNPGTQWLLEIMGAFMAKGERADRARRKFRRKIL